ncbi:MAG: hypothetical protein RR371_04770, partial [Bacteroides sp.]
PGINQKHQIVPKLYPLPRGTFHKALIFKAKIPYWLKNKAKLIGGSSYFGDAHFRLEVLILKRIIYKTKG